MANVITFVQHETDKVIKLNVGNTKLAIKTLRGFAKGEGILTDDLGICNNLHSTLNYNRRGSSCGYSIVCKFSVGFPDVVMSRVHANYADCYPIGKPALGVLGKDMWKDQRRLDLCTHIADVLESYLEAYWYHGTKFNL